MTTSASVTLSPGSVIHEAKFVDVKGIRTRYYEVGDGEPMLLIHGAVFSGTASANTWTRNLAGLGQTYHVYAPDRLGNGITDNPKTDDEYTVEAVIQHLYDFTQAIGMRSVHVVGQSLGAYLAAKLTLDHLEMVKTLVLVDTASLAPDVGNFSERLAKVNEGRPTDIKEYIRFYWERMSYTTEHVTDDYVDAGYFMEMLPKSQETKKKMVAFAEASWRKSIVAQKQETLDWLKEGRLQVPTLLYWAANDPTAILPMGILLLDIIREKTPRTQMHIMNHGGHFHYREYPDEFNKVVTNFIQSS